jgi:hypothetical protein
MLAIVGVLFSIVGYALAIAIVGFVATAFGLMGSVLLKGIISVLSGPSDAVITVRYPVANPKVRTMKELTDVNVGTNRAAVPSRSSSFFEDVNGVDLEYRGVGAGKGVAAAAAVGKAVSQRG